MSDKPLVFGFLLFGFEEHNMDVYVARDWNKTRHVPG